MCAVRQDTDWMFAVTYAGLKYFYDQINSSLQVEINYSKPEIEVRLLIDMNLSRFDITLTDHKYNKFPIYNYNQQDIYGAVKRCNLLGLPEVTGGTGVLLEKDSAGVIVPNNLINNLTEFDKKLFFLSNFKGKSSHNVKKDDSLWKINDEGRLFTVGHNFTVFPFVINKILGKFYYPIIFSLEYGGVEPLYITESKFNEMIPILFNSYGRLLKNMKFDRLPHYIIYTKPEAPYLFSTVREKMSFKVEEIEEQESNNEMSLPKLTLKISIENDEDEQQ